MGNDGKVGERSSGSGDRPQGKRMSLAKGFQKLVTIARKEPQQFKKDMERLEQEIAPALRSPKRPIKLRLLAVAAWLLVNSIRIQFAMLQLQNLANVWSTIGTAKGAVRDVDQAVGQKIRRLEQELGVKRRKSC
ncbi:hypothetical protein AK812_SmicGene7195 [Symbiodinium microadriaticum]|uniref:Uncharacterized protein n=1 Tax=Symbiodinium microadriaticum TaxID=2951 RepID=A0A1Q9EPB3_SYMMI|nr:hypothetical protein AK812_SmicGene7195 [Symbiodinium microadriaticum]